MVTVAFLCVVFIRFNGSIDSALVSPPMPTSSSAPRLSTLRTRAAPDAPDVHEAADDDVEKQAREIVRA